MTVKRIVTPNKFIGLSTDTKLTQATDSRVRIGDTFYEYDTDLLYITYDGTNWVIKRDATDEGAWTFGEPSLYAARNSDATWVKTSPASIYQKGSTQWCANLYGGVQTNDDWASLVIPVNELPVTALASAMWTYYMTAAESAGVNIVVWVHDPTAFNKRAEITQTMGEASKVLGWNVESLSTTATEMFFYGEGVTGNTTCTTAGTQYTWAQFQADALFSTWTIYRISLDYGWLASTTLDDAWVTDVKINGQQIVLKPDSGGTGRIGHRSYGTSAATATHTLTPKAPFRLLNTRCEISAAGTTSESLTITMDSIAGSADGKYDVLLYSVNTLTGSATGGAITSLFITFGEGYDLQAGDELIMAWPNTETRDLGWVWTYQTVF